jgi:hypothetical protein
MRDTYQRWLSWTTNITWDRFVMRKIVHMYQVYLFNVNTSGKTGAQILHLPLGDDSSPLGDNAVGR